MSTALATSVNQGTAANSLDIAHGRIRLLEEFAYCDHPNPRLRVVAKTLNRQEMFGPKHEHRLKAQGPSESSGF